MKKLLLRLFVKNHTDTRNPAVRTQYGKLAGITGIFCNLLLFAGKLVVGTLCKSVSITADAVNNLSDASSSVVTLLGFKFAGKPADPEHPVWAQPDGISVGALRGGNDSAHWRGAGQNLSG